MQAGVTPFTLAALMLSGAAFGSFAALVADRLAAGQGWAVGRSRCDGCGRTLRILDLAPIVSFAAAGGRARCCGARLRASLPLAEAAGFVIPLLAAAVAPTSALLIATCALGWALLTLALIDIATLRLPDALTLPLLLAGLALSVANLTGPLAAHALGAAFGWGAVAAAAALWRRLRGVEGIGLGDAKLLGAAGAWVGAGGLSGVMLWACALGLLTAAVVAARGGDWRAPQPFGPALAAGFWLTWVFGPPTFG